jgi:hypothetical protein
VYLPVQEKIIFRGRGKKMKKTLEKRDKSDDKLEITIETI